MSFKVKPIANNIEDHVLTFNEKLMKDVCNIYGVKDGLKSIAKMMDVGIRAPRRKITVLLMGNHSAGKSSFINWYIEEGILKTGVAVETQGFTIVTSGKKRETLKGLATLQLYPHLKPLTAKQGVLEYLTTEISSSRAKNFNMVSFIDTPGLVDGDMHYPFDVNDALLWLGNMADMVFVFFDPMGQAMCKRTLNIVEKLWENNSEKIRMYMAKADEVGSETDRQKVLMQTVQELCKRPGLNRTGFDMPTIYLPEGPGAKSRCANQIQEVCAQVDKKIEETLQNCLNDLKADVDQCEQVLHSRLENDKESRKRNKKQMCRGFILGAFGILVPIVMAVSLIVANASEKEMRRHLGRSADVIRLVFGPAAVVWTNIPATYHLQLVTAVVIMSGMMLILSRISDTEPVYPNRELRALEAAVTKLQQFSGLQKSLYDSYLKQSVDDDADL
ncbi:unnamed protein product [Allacma fusca]|uniref:G domain-containing protein n=1 Tax=Allacma fusca TaxID=39272 RepID=A0A8J2JV87_9HEXA|nr:unnamed protein product [Allacma fusca]